MYLHIYMFSIYTYPFLDLTQQFSLPAAPSRLIKGDLFLQSVGLMPSLNLAFPGSFTLPFWCRNQGGWGSFLFSLSTASSWKRGSLPSSLSRLGFQDFLERMPCAREPYKPCARALLIFHIPWGILASLSLSLSSSFLYTVFFERLTNSRTEAFCHSTSLHPPRIRTWPSSPGELRRYSGAP